MFRRVAYLAVSALTLATTLTSCATFKYEPREAWRAQAERSCMSEHPFRRDPHVEELGRIRDHLICGMIKPLSVSALADGGVAITPTATMDCPMATTLEDWLAGAVQPVALARLGSPVVAIHDYGAYSCRPVNNQRGGSPSEHAFGNAIDIASFELADGRIISVAHDWYGGTQAEREFLRDIEARACQYFRTVLGPGYPEHDDHFHLDMAQRTTAYCNPSPTIPPYRAADADTGAADATPMAYAEGEVPATMFATPETAGEAIGQLIGALTR